MHCCLLWCIFDAWHEYWYQERKTFSQIRNFNWKVDPKYISCFSVRLSDCFSVKASRIGKYSRTPPIISICDVWEHVVFRLVISRFLERPPLPLPNSTKHSRKHITTHHFTNPNYLRDLMKLVKINYEQISSLLIIIIIIIIIILITTNLQNHKLCHYRTADGQWPRKLGYQQCQFIFKGNKNALAQHVSSVYSKKWPWS